MWSIEDVLSELKEEEEKNKERSGGLPPGFRFHPTDEELITFYLASKVFNHPPSNYPNLPTLTTSTLLFSPAVHIPEVDLNRCEPWDLPERAKMGEREWYFYSVRDRKYPTGLRTNRATGTGYWKATGKDKHVYATTNNNNNNYKTNKKSNYNYHGDHHHESALIGMKKTLVFYQGRAPRGVKTPWVMHEYRLDGHFSSFRLSSSKEEWVICRIFHKHAGSGGNENKKARASPTNYINNFMMSSCLPPLLDAPPTTTTPTTTCSLPPPPPLPSLLSYFSSPSFSHPTSAATTSTATLPPFSSAPLDDFPQLSQCPDEDTLPSLSAIAMNMKQENNQQNWLDKILSPQHQLMHLNPNYYDHDQIVLGDLADDDKFRDLVHPSSSFGAPNCFPDHAEVSASLAAAAALDRLLDHPPLFQPL